MDSLYLQELMMMKTKFSRASVMKPSENKNSIPSCHQIKDRREHQSSLVQMNIFPHTEEEIKEEIIIENNWLIEGIENIYKFPNKNIMKIQFKQALEVKKKKNAAVHEIHAFNMSIVQSNIKKEEYIPINTCMRCYAINSHFTSNCLKGEDYKACSKCGNEDHIWKNCHQTAKKCINCQGKHRTLAYECPVRKSAREEKN